MLCSWKVQTLYFRVIRWLDRPCGQLVTIWGHDWPSKCPWRYHMQSFYHNSQGVARMWCNNLPPSSIQSSQEFGTRFIFHFPGTRKQSKPSTHLFTVKQRFTKSLKDYACGFNQGSLMINNLNEGVAIAAFMERVSSPYCLMTLARMTQRQFQSFWKRSTNR